MNNSNYRENKVVKRRLSKRRKNLKRGVVLVLLGAVGTISMLQVINGQEQEESWGIEQELMQPSVTGEDWRLVLVNKKNSLPVEHEIETMQLRNGQVIDKRIYEDLQQMMDDARAQGLSPIICSSYRSNEKQIRLFNNEIRDFINKGYSEEEAEEEAKKWVAIPGTSEHELGLALDIVSESYQVLSKEQENTPEQQWLMQNCYKYGFILRYPEDKTHLTGISYEPWHYRYVGREAAEEITKNGLCLEEYLMKKDIV